MRLRTLLRITRQFDKSIEWLSTDEDRPKSMQPDCTPKGKCWKKLPSRKAANRGAVAPK